MRRITVVLIGIILVAGLLMSGCSGGDGDGDGGNGVIFDNALIGTWQPYMATVDGTQVSPKQAMDWGQNVVLITVQFANAGALQVTEYDADGQTVDTENGAWTGNNGSGTLVIDGETTNFTYTFNGQVLQINFTEDGSQVSIRWVPVFTSTTRAADLSRAWQVTAIQENGADQSVVDFFEFPERADAVVLQLIADGTMHVFSIESADGTVVEHAQGTWATQGELMMIQPPEASILRGVWAANNTSLTFLDEDGSTTHFELSPWAPAGEHDADLVGQWTPQQVTVNGQSVPLADFFDWDPQASYMLMDFWPDGTTVNREMSAADEVVWGALGNWNTSNSELTLNIDVTIVMDYTINGNTLTVDFVQDGDDVTIVWNRIST
jgi:hypothetical protein